MTAATNSARALSRRPGTLAGRGPLAWLRDLLVVVVLGGAAAIATGDAALPLIFVIVGAAGVSVALVVFASPGLSAVLLGASIPEVQDLTGGHLGLHIAASDVLLVLIGGRVLAEATVHQQAPALRALRRVRLPLLQYAWMIVLLLVFHLGLGTIAKSLQRVELFALPALVGAYLALRGQHMNVLRGYVIGCTLLAIAWSVDSGGLAAEFQKNPTGGFIASAILLLLSVRSLRRWLWCMPVLLVGVALTESRGALLALGVGVVVIVMFLLHSSAGRRGQMLTRVLALIVTAVVVYQFLPSNVTSRLSNYSAGQKSRSSYALYIRQEYDADAEHLIAAHPWTGVGVGNYLAGSNYLGTQTTDPHNVILLEAAEGGYLFAASFLLLIGGLALAMWRLRRVEIAAAAAAVLLATFAHGLVDVYWVRGTPVFGFLLVGIVCGVAANRRATGAPA